jgi:hypothetical protein
VTIGLAAAPSRISRSRDARIDMRDLDDGPDLDADYQPPPSPIYSSFAGLSNLLLSTSPTSYVSRRLAFYLGRGEATQKSRRPSFITSSSFPPRSRKNSLIGGRSRKTSSASIVPSIDRKESLYFDFDLPSPLSKKSFASPSLKGSILWKSYSRKKSLQQSTKARKISVSGPPTRKTSSIDIQQPPAIDRKESVYYESSAADFQPSWRRDGVGSLAPSPSYSDVAERKLSKLRLNNHNHHHHHHKTHKVSVLGKKNDFFWRIGVCRIKVASTTFPFRITDLTVSCHHLINAA